MEETIEQPKKGRGWPKGKVRGPRPVAPQMFTPAPEPEAPIHVRVTRKGMEPFVFGCASHFVENGFHVFLYPSRRDPYRTTRREIAISEIIDIEITAARQMEMPAPPPWMTEPIPIGPAAASAPTGPKIHSAKRSAMSMIEQMASSDGPIRMDTPPGIAFGDSAG